MPCMQIWTVRPSKHQKHGMQQNMLMKLNGGTPFILAHDPARGRLGACHQHAPIHARHRPGAPLGPMYPHGPVPQDVPSHGGLATCMHVNQFCNMEWNANTDRMHTMQMQDVAQNQIAMQMQSVVQIKVALATQRTCTHHSCQNNHS